MGQRMKSTAFLLARVHHTAQGSKIHMDSEANGSVRHAGSVQTGTVAHRDRYDLLEKVSWKLFPRSLCLNVTH